MGELIGAFLSQLFLTYITLKIVSKWSGGAKGVFIASAVSLALGTLLRGLGMMDGRSAKFLEGFEVSLVPQIFVSIFFLWAERQQNSKNSNLDLAENTPEAPKALNSAAVMTPWHKRYIGQIVGLLAFAGAWFGSQEAVRYFRSPTEAQRQQASHQGLLVARDELKKSLPRKLDPTTSLIDVRVEGLNLTYTHEIGSDYQINDLKSLEQQVKNRVCASEMVKSISNGVSYTYEYLSPPPEKRPWGQFTISSCP